MNQPPRIKPVYQLGSNSNGKRPYDRNQSSSKKKANSIVISDFNTYETDKNEQSDYEDDESNNFQTNYSCNMSNSNELEEYLLF